MSITREKLLADQRVHEWLLLEQGRREREQAATKKTLKPIITISRQTGAHGDQITAEALEMLGVQWQVWDKEIIEAVADHASVRHQMVEAVEHSHSNFLEIVKSFLGIQTFEEGSYRLHLTQIIYAIAHHPYQMIVGRGANFILPKALNICIKAPRAYRLNTVMEQLAVSRAQAEAMLTKADRERAESIRSLFHRDPDDDAYYDIVFNVDQLGVKATAASIVAAARSRFDLSE